MSALLLVTSLLAASVPAVRLASRRAVRDELRARPATAAALLLLVVGAAFGVWRLTRGSPAAALAATSTLLVIVAVLWWRARPSWGRRRRLPPGSLGLGDSLDAITDPRFYADRVGRWGPVFKTSQFHRPVVCVADLSLADRLLTGHDRDLVPPRLPFWRVSPRGHLAFLDDVAHPRHRAVLSRVLDESTVSEARPGLVDVIDTELLQLAAAEAGQGASPDPHLDRVVYAATLYVITGSAPEPRELDQLAADFRRVARPRWLRGRSPVDRPGFDDLVAWMRTQAAEVRHRADALEATPPCLMREILAVQPDALTDDVLLGNLVLIALVTFGGARGTLGWVLKEALDHPEVLDEVRHIPDGPRRDAWADRFVWETLRRHQSEHIYRETARPIEVDGYHVPRGWLIRVCVREAHEDPRVFDDPGRFRPSRFEGPGYGVRFRPFSDGTHIGFGAELAVATSAVFLLRLADAFEVAVVADGPPERSGNRHWSHWRPSPSLRVSSTRRDLP